MIQIHSKVVDLIIAVILMFLVPIQYFNHIEAITRELQIRQVTSKFVENICTHGYLSKQMYENYVRELGETNHVFDVTLEHKQQVIEPVYQLSLSGGEPWFTGDVMEYELILYTEEIMEVLYSSAKRYEMNRGDTIKVVLRTKTSRASEIGTMSNVSLRSGIEETESIYTSYSGEIRDVQ